MYQLIDSAIPVYNKELLEIATSNLWLAVSEPHFLPQKKDLNPITLIKLNIYDQLVEEVQEWYEDRLDQDNLERYNFELYDG